MIPPPSAPPRWKRRLIALIAASPLPGLTYRALAFWQRIARPLTVGVRAVVTDGEGRVLLVRHSYLSGWHLPGGRVGKGETAAMAAARELGEETGLAVLGPPRLLGLYGRFGHGGSDHIAVYVVEHWAGALCPDGLEVAEAGFFALGHLPEGTTQATLRRLREYRGLAATPDHW
ncbi:MAG: NUDIX domain-containing protein [Rhodospirillaceae bacterium]